MSTLSLPHMSGCFSIVGARRLLVARIAAIVLVALTVTPFTAPFSAMDLADFTADHPLSADDAKVPMKEAHDFGVGSGLSLVLLTLVQEGMVPQLIAARPPRLAVPLTLVLRI